MLYKQEQIPVHAEGFAETTHFDIPASGKAFKSLIDNIYSRKIEAPIRELSTNAWDAHREAGIDEPFRMKLPTKFDPLFMVRDYGLGMTHDFIMGTGEHAGGGFKSLFASTKDQENVSVGMKGLGSKSPFAYTDSFILRVFSGETVRTYSTYLGENGIPQLAYQGESASTDRRGVAVQFPVQMKDIDAFYDSATRVLKGFDTLPEGLPRTVLDRLESSASKPLEGGSFWRCYHKEWLGEGAFAKQGCVIYPIDLDKFENGKWIKTLGQSILIDFPIGSVQMVDSREFLAYDEETIANINEACDKIKAEIDDRIKVLLAQAKTPWDIRLLFRQDLFSNLGPLARTSSHYNRVLAINSFMKEALPRAKRYRNSSQQQFYSVVSPQGEADSPYVAYTRNDEAFRERLLDDPVFVYVGTDTKLRRHMNLRAKLYMEQNENVTGVVMLEHIKLAMFRKLGKPKIMRLKDLPEPPKVERAARAPISWERFQQFNENYGTQIEEIDEDVLATDDLTNHYLFINKGNVFLPGVSEPFNRSDLHSTDRMLRFFLKSRIVFINVRLNEKLDRWPEAQYPRYRDGLLDGVISTLGRAQVIPMINAINHDRFEDSSYDRALNKLGLERIRKARDGGYTNPFFDLARFEERKDRLTTEQKNIFGCLTGEMREQIIDRALELGLEVLPEVASGSPWDRFVGFPYPLLPAKWERMAQYLGEWSSENQRDLFIDLIMKEFGKC